MSDDCQAIVIDNGSGVCRVGLAGEDAPTAVFRSVVGVPTVSIQNKRTYVGEKAVERRRMLKVHHPIERGVITSWGDMEKVWSHALNSVGVPVEDYPVLITDALLDLKFNREEMFSIMFDKFNAMSLYVAYHADLTLYASGRTSGIVVSSGEGVTNVVPVYDGYHVTHAICNLGLAGRDLTKFLTTLLSDKGYRFTKAEAELSKRFKEKYCFVSQDYDKESNEEKEYELPDGTRIAVSDELYKCPEALFRPTLMGIEGMGVHECIFQAVQKCDIDIRKELQGNIVLSGGTTLFTGFEERLSKELARGQKGNRVKYGIVADEGREELVWLGGSILSSLSTFQENWISKEEYLEVGPSVAYRKLDR
ncbi:actin [Acrasis kona]|uniref:Actin n=1 Tax=Acrasis kona TaxID=1008807 RepID=A0AAW2ZJK3_9EUKA